MSRLPEITNRDGLDAASQAAFDSIMTQRGRVGGPFALLMNSPRVAEHVSPIGYYLRFESPLPAADRELATLTAARIMDCAFEWAAHHPLALEAGVPIEVLNIIAERRPPEGVDGEYALPIRFVAEALMDHRVSDETFAAAQERYGDQGVMELTALAGYYALIATVLNVMDVQPADGAPILP